MTHRVGQNEYVVASDASAIVEHPRRVKIFRSQRNEGMATSSTGYFPHLHDDDIEVSPSSSQLENKSKSTSWADYEHYMLKEILRAHAAMRR